MWDHVTGALNDDGIADAHVLAGDLVLVVQRRIGDHDTAHCHGFEFGDRRQRAGATDLDFDIAQDGRYFLGRKFMRDGPTWRTRDEAQPLLPIYTVDLVDDAVDVVTKARPFRLDFAIELEQPRNAVITAHQWINW